MRNKTINNKTIVYYTILSVITLVLTSATKEYNSIFRVGYLLLVLFPSVKDIKHLPFAITAFWGISMCSLSPFFPTNKIIEITLITAVLFMNRIAIPNLSRFFILILYFILVDILHFEWQEQMWSFLLITMLISLPITEKVDLRLLALGLSCMALIVSIMYLIHYQEFLFMYSSNDVGVERSSWTNPNFLGGHIAVGVIASSWLLFYNKDGDRQKMIRTFSIGVMLIGFVVLVMNASRGSLFSTTAISLYFLLLSNQSKKIKLLVVLTVVALVIFMLNNNMFDLVLYRLGSDTTDTGGGRFDIWGKKMEAFQSEGFLSLLFGIGQEACDNIGIFNKTHNDFISSIIAYGYVGFFLFVGFIFYPLKLAAKSVKLQVAGLTLFLCVECVTLEPLFRGYFVFMIYYLFVYKIAKFSNQNN